jgi:lysosomal alpha-mannosidase
MLTQVVPKSKFVSQFEGLTRPLPINVQLLTLEPWKDDAYVLRFEHILEKDEDDVLSQPTTIDLAVNCSSV